MADYYNILSNAIDEMDASTSEAREAVFARARAALRAQIAGLDPPLSEEAEKEQWDAIDGAIGRITAERAVADSLARQEPPAAAEDAKESAAAEEGAETGAEAAEQEDEQRAVATAEDAPAAPPLGETVKPDDAVVETKEKDDPAEANAAKDDAAEATIAKDDSAKLVAEKEPAAPAAEPSGDAGEDDVGKVKLAADEAAGELSIAASAPLLGSDAGAPSLDSGFMPPERAEPLLAAAETDSAPRPPEPEDRQAAPERRRGRGGLMAFMLLLLLIASGGAAAYFNWDETRALVEQYTGYELPGLSSLLTWPSADQQVSGEGGRDGTANPGSAPAGGEGAAAPGEQARPAQDAPQAAAQNEAPAAEAPRAEAPNGPPASTDAGASASPPVTQSTPQPQAAPPAAEVNTASTQQAQQETAEPRPPTRNDAAPASPQADSEPPAAEAARGEAPAAEAAGQGETQVAQAPEQTAAAPKDQERPAAQEPVTEPALFAVEQTTGAAAGQDVRHGGKTLWSVSGSGKGAVLTAAVDIAGRDATFRIELRRNDDKTLPASHTLQLVHQPAKGDDDGHVMNVPGLMVREQDNEQGKPLRGAGAPVVPGQFLMGLTDTPAARKANIELLSTGKWLVIPVLMENKKRALLVIGVGRSGAAAIAAAFKAWGEEAPPKAAEPAKAQ